MTDGAWWDYVDAIAGRLLGGLLARYPREMKTHMLDWARSPDIWKRRTAILCQLSFKDATDTRLLHACIEPSLGHPEFFLRKAIEWALRQHARTDPEGVIAYITENARRMSALSKREALRVVVKAGLVDAVP